VIAGLDSSSFRPSAAVARQARADGVQLWSGYLQSRSGVGIYSPWDRQSFENARLCGSTPIAWASGWDDPVACRRLADSWNVRLGVDVEGGGLRPDGSWIQSWIDAAGRDRTGLYGNYWVFQRGVTAAFSVVGGYPGYDPKSTWGYVPRPAGPCGWQFMGSHTEYGGTVDRGNYDDWFAQGAQDTMAVLSDAQAATLLAQVQDIHGGVGAMVSFGGPSLPLIFQLLQQLNVLHDKLAELEGKVQAPPAVDVEALASALAAHLPSGVDVKAVAQAVVDEIGVRVRPA
jgi:hypothetical protein